MKSITKETLKKLVYEVNGAAIEVHKHLGAGLLESIYQSAMEYELSARGIRFIRQIHIPVYYKDEILIVELKAVAEIHPIHITQTLTYMRLLQKPEGLIINFNCVNIFLHGQRTVVNDLYRFLPEK